MIVVYTGNGKGKTSASTGQVVRALGHGYSVAFGQFMKNDDKSGEQHVLKKLIEDVYIAGPGFLLHPDEMPHQQECAQKRLQWAHTMLEKVHVLVLDEALYALSYDIISQSDMEELIKKARVLDKDLILSGRGLPDWLRDEADLVSEITEIKHPYKQGIGAKAGIDF